MGHLTIKQGKHLVSWPSNSLRAFIIVLIALAVLWQNTVSLAEAKLTHSTKHQKGSLKLLKTSSSSLLHQSLSLPKSHQRRFKRETSAESFGSIEEEPFYDENYDVVPVIPDDAPKTLGEHVSEKAKEIAESFSQMWQSIADSVKRCVDAVRRFFSSDGDMYELTPEQEEQMRAAMEARAKAIEEQNELYRNTYGNQI